MRKASVLILLATIGVASAQALSINPGVLAVHRSALAGGQSGSACCCTDCKCGPDRACCDECKCSGDCKCSPACECCKGECCGKSAAKNAAKVGVAAKCTHASASCGDKPAAGRKAKDAPKGADPKAACTRCGDACERAPACKRGS
jgi:hypothetical protein